MTPADLLARFPGPLPDGTRVGFRILPEARGVLVGSSWDLRHVRLDGTGRLVEAKNTDLFKEDDHG